MINFLGYVHLLKISKLSSIDFNLWDEYVKQHSDASPYHLIAFLHTIEKSYSLRSCYLIAKQQEKVVGVLPIAIFKSLTMQKRFCSLPFCDVGNCLAESIAIKNSLIMHAEQIKNQCGITIWDYRDCQELSKLERFSEISKEQAKVRMILPLPKTSEKLLKGFKAKLRNQIRKAQKNELKVEINSANCIDDFFYVYSQNMKTLGSPPHSLSWFETLSAHYKTDLNVVVIKHNQQPVAAGIQLISGKNCSIPWASSLRKYNSLNGNMLLYWNLLELAIDNRCTYFDFGRSTFAGSTYKFKKQWGAFPLALQWQQNDGIPLITNNNVRLTRKLLAIFWSQLPMPFSNWLGAKLRKFIAL